VKTNPIQTQTNPICQMVKLMQSVYLQRIMKKNAAKGYEKTKPKQTQFPKCQNECNLKYNKGLWQFSALRPPKKQTQTNPISNATMVFLLITQEIAKAPSFLACLCDSRRKTRQQAKARCGPLNNILWSFPAKRSQDKFPLRRNYLGV